MGLCWGLIPPLRGKRKKMTIPFSRWGEEWTDRLCDMHNFPDLKFSFLCSTPGWLVQMSLAWILTSSHLVLSVPLSRFLKVGLKPLTPTWFYVPAHSRCSVIACYVAYLVPSLEQLLYPALLCTLTYSILLNSAALCSRYIFIPV